MAEEAVGSSRSWSQLLQCGSHLLDSAHCVSSASQSVARCAVNVPNDLLPLLERIKSAQGMTKQGINTTRELMRCSEVISERGLKAAELANRLVTQSRDLAGTLRAVSEADQMSSFACRRLATTFTCLAALARDTADASAAAAVVLGDAQQHAASLKVMLDKLKHKEEEKEEGEKDEKEDKDAGDESSDEEHQETPQERASTNRRLLQKLNSEVLDLQKEMRTLVSGNPSLLPEVSVKQKERLFVLAREFIQQSKWRVSMLGLQGKRGPADWSEAMQETLQLVKAAASWDGLAAPCFEARVLRAAALVDAGLLQSMLEELFQQCLALDTEGGKRDDVKQQFLESVGLLCRHHQFKA